MRVLVGILAHTLRSETLRRAHSLKWDDDDGYHVLTHWGADMRPGENRFQTVTRKYKELQRIFLSGPFDVLLTIEQDMLVPPDALMNLSKLIKDGADIAYATYCWRYENQLWLNAHPKIEEDAGGAPWFWSLSQYKSEARKHWGQPIQVQGLGLGCTMLSRHTLTRLEFRMERDDHCCDTTLAMDAQKEGLIQISDLGTLCGHYLDDTRIIWPDITQPDLYRIVQE